MTSEELYKRMKEEIDGIPITEADSFLCSLDVFVDILLQAIRTARYKFYESNTKPPNCLCITPDLRIMLTQYARKSAAICDVPPHTMTAFGMDVVELNGDSDWFVCLRKKPEE